MNSLGEDGASLVSLGEPKLMYAQLDFLRCIARTRSCFSVASTPKTSLHCSSIVLNFEPEKVGHRDEHWNPRNEHR